MRDRPTCPPCRRSSAVGQSRLMRVYNDRAGIVRRGGRSGAGRPARLRRPAPIPARPQHPGPIARAGLRADHQRERRDRQRRDCATATTTGSPLWWRTPWAPMCWCCSPTLDGLFTADPRRDPSASLIEIGRRRRSVAVDPRQRRRERPGERRNGEQTGGGPDRLVVRGPHGDRPRVAARTCCPTRWPTTLGRHHVRRPRSAAAGAQAVDRLRRRGRPARSRSTRAPERALTDALDQPAASRCPSRSSGHFDEGDTVDVAGPDGRSSPAAWSFVAADDLRQVVGPSHERPTDGHGRTRSSTATTSSCCRADCVVSTQCSQRLRPRRFRARLRGSRPRRLCRGRARHAVR